MYRCNKVFLQHGRAIITSEPYRATRRSLRAAVGSPGGHADLRVILSPSTDPSFYKAGRWTQMGIAPLPSWSASHGWVQVSFVRAYLLFTAFPPERTTDFSHPAKSTKPLEGPCWHFSITHESVQCSGPRSNPFDSRAPTVTARHSPSRGNGTPPPDTSGFAQLCHLQGVSQME